MPDSLTEEALRAHHAREEARRAREAEQARAHEEAQRAGAARAAQALSGLLGVPLAVDGTTASADGGRVMFDFTHNPHALHARCPKCGAEGPPFAVPTLPSGIITRKELLERIGGSAAAVPCNCEQEAEKPRQDAPGGRKTGRK